MCGKNLNKKVAQKTCKKCNSDFAISQGYEVMVIWESDYRKDK